jgi:D-tyrosyl-tRNA(Tyr) deacylase
MRILLQRVKSARVEVEGSAPSAIGAGLLLFLGIGKGDSEREAEVLVEKIFRLRIFSDEEGKMNKSVVDIGGEILLVSQFTLYADCKKGNRPSFTDAAPPEEAHRLYEYMIRTLGKSTVEVKTGTFGAHMQVTLVNDGPVTILLDTEEA